MTTTVPQLQARQAKTAAVPTVWKIMLTMPRARSLWVAASEMLPKLEAVMSPGRVE